MNTFCIVQTLNDSCFSDINHHQLLELKKVTCQHKILLKYLLKGANILKSMCLGKSSGMTQLPRPISKHKWPINALLYILRFTSSSFPYVFAIAHTNIPIINFSKELDLFLYQQPYIIWTGLMNCRKVKNLLPAYRSHITLLYSITLLLRKCNKLNWRIFRYPKMIKIYDDLNISLFWIKNWMSLND